MTPNLEIYSFIIIACWVTCLLFSFFGILVLVSVLLPTDGRRICTPIPKCLCLMCMLFNFYMGGAKLVMYLFIMNFILLHD